jgi:hypothetical protein
MFSDATDGAERAQRLEDYKAALSDSHKEGLGGRTRLNKGRNGEPNRLEKSAPTIQGVDPARVEALFGNLKKSVTTDNGAALGADLEALKSDLIAQVTKDWSPTNPLTSNQTGGGLVPFDLEGPAKILVPQYTPLRNSIPRTKGQGNARRFKRIDSWSNSGQATAQTTPFFNSVTNTATFGSGLALNRPSKINYTGSDKVVGYVELGFSDSVEWISQFEGLGFDDLRALSHTAVLWSHLMGEERAMLYGRGSGTGYEGVVASPTTTVSASGSGSNFAAVPYTVWITSNTGFGESVAVNPTGSPITPAAGQNLVLTFNAAEPTGAITYGVYVGTAAGAANGRFQGYFTPTTVAGVTTITLTNFNAAGPLGAPTVDASANTNGYDGYLAVQSDPTLSGYFSRVNAALSTSNPGVEFDTALAAMFVANGADPDEIWLTPALKVEFAELMRQGGSAGFGNGYRTNLVTGDNGVTIGTSVSGFMNAATGKVLDVRAHRFMPKGAALIRSTSIPIPNANIPAPVAAVNVQDYMAVDWPDIQMTYDVSTYQIGTLVHYAPLWNGLLLGVA